MPSGEVVHYRGGQQGPLRGRRVQEAEEEWVTKKKVEITTKKNVERKIHRQLVLEDGRVVEEEIPTVTVDTTEDKQTFETDQDEERNLEGGTSGVAFPKNTNPKGGVLLGDKFTSVKKVNDVKENLVKTEAVKNLGDISRRNVNKVLKEKEDIRKFLKQKQGEENHQVVVPPRTVFTARNHRVITDKEDIQERNWVNNGKMHNERIRTEEHIEYDSDDTPDSGSSSSSSSHVKLEPEIYKTRKDENFTEYYKVGKGDKYVKVGEGPHNVSESKEVQREEDRQILDSRGRSSKHLPQTLKMADLEIRDRNDVTGLSRIKKDSNHTDSWLERHFGSSSSSNSLSNSSVDLSRPGSRDGYGGLRRSASICDIRPVDNSSGVYYATVLKSGKVPPEVVMRDKKDKGDYSQNRQSANFSSSGHPIRPPRRRETGGRADYEEYNSKRTNSHSIQRASHKVTNKEIERLTRSENNKRQGGGERLFSSLQRNKPPKALEHEQGRSQSANITERYYFGNPVTVKKSQEPSVATNKTDSSHHRLQTSGRNLERQSKHASSVGNIHRASVAPSSITNVGRLSSHHGKGLKNERHHLSYSDIRQSKNDNQKYRSSGDLVNLSHSSTPSSDSRRIIHKDERHLRSKKTEERGSKIYEAPGTPHRIIYSTHSPMGSPSTKYRTKIVINGPG